MQLLDFADVQYINLETFKKDGSKVTTPVWVAQQNNSLVVTTGNNSGKVKRIRNNGKAIIYTTNQSGSKKLSEELEVKGSILSDEDLKTEAVTILKKKYGMMAKMMLKGPNENRAIIVLEEKGV
ncbi:MAG: PPOX class F420-dependent oxidoreductase [Methylophilaceae bacterium]